MAEVAIADRMELADPMIDLRFERTFDAGLVRSIIVTPSIYRSASDDGCPSSGDFVLCAHAAIWWVLAYDGDELLGCFVLHPDNSTTYQVHTCLYPRAAGRATEAAQRLIPWIWGNVPCLRLTTRVPVFNRLALRLARKACMIEYGRDLMSFQKHGTLWDEVLLGISKPGVR